MQKILIFTVFIVFSIETYSQITNDTSSKEYFDYSRPREYIIADIEVTGVQFLQASHLVSISGLSKGMKIQIPGSEISEAIKKYWKYGLFSNVQILVKKIEDGKVYLQIDLTENQRLNELKIKGINKSERDDIEEKIDLKRGIQVTENILNNSVLIIKKHFKEKGFLNTAVTIEQETDTANINLVNLTLRIEKNKRVKIQEIKFEGNSVYTAKRLRRVMKKTKQIDINIFKGSKYIEADYKEDRKKLLEFYNKNGYRDAHILSEEQYVINKKRIGLKFVLFEGNQYHLRSITWVGNTKYPVELLSAVLGMKAGDVYNQKLLEDRLRVDEDGITSLYMDNGYLFFNINPVEAKIENDSVDLELRIYEGDQATLNSINIAGNTKTNEHVVRRELYTRPGELFSRSDIIRSVRELATLGHFNPETILPNPVPNPSDGTVDINYSLEERANDQLELSGGWGGYYGFIGTVRVRFTNFSVRNMHKLSAWRPVPSGDGQTLQVGFQSSGRYYQGYNLTFIEPWFGGKKPNSLSVSLFHSNRRPYNTNSNDTLNPSFKTNGISLGLGKRLKWPDDYFSIYSELSYQQYKLHNYDLYLLDNGKFNILTLKLALSRSSQDQMIYPRKGSSMSVSVRLTPPYSLLSQRNYSDMSYGERFRQIEFHKWNFAGTTFNALIQNLVLAIHSEFGYLAAYNKSIGPPPFEKFDIGGSGLTGYDLYGTDVIALRGYEEGHVTPMSSTVINGTTKSYENGNIYTRYWAELRYPFSLNPSATIYGLVFIEGGNAWETWDTFNPFSVKRAAGVGVRAFLPMFGLLGVDWGYGFDNDRFGQKSGSQWHFVLGQQM